MTNIKIAISLDFEMLWGFMPNPTRVDSRYLRNIENVPKVVDMLLSIFDKHNCISNWAVVDAMRFHSFSEVYNFLESAGLLDYFISEIGDFSRHAATFGNEMLFAPNLVRKVEKNPRTNIGSHSFTHTPFSFSSKAATLDILASSYHSLIRKKPRKFYIFPRNEYNSDLISCLSDNHFKSFRSETNSPLYGTSRFGVRPQRVLRYVDAYIKIIDPSLSPNSNLLVKAHQGTMFVRSQCANSIGINLQAKRIISHVDTCVKRGVVPHLWWHPHNMGGNLEYSERLLGLLLTQLKNKYENIDWCRMA